MTSTAASPAIPVVVGAPLATVVATATPNGQAPSGDFLLMLGQLISANVTPVAQPKLTETTVTEDASVEDETAALEEANAMALAGVAPLAAPPMAIAPMAASSSRTPTVESDALVMPDMTTELKRARAPAVSQASPVFVSAEALAGLSAQPSPIDASPVAIEPLHISAAPLESAPARAAVHEAMISRPIHTPVGSQPWADEIGARLTMMAEAGKQTASLRLSPEHLGPLEIRIAIQDDQASVWFGAAHADTRAAIEHALPRLRELFEANGMSLADAGVHHQTPRGGETNPVFSRDVAPEAVDEESGRAQNVAVNARLVDAYA